MNPELKRARLRALQRQIARLERHEAALSARSDRFSRLRLLIFSAGAVLAFLAFSQISDAAGYGALVLTFIVFNVAAYYHRHVKAAIIDHGRWRAIKAAHRARVLLDWDALPPAAPIDAPPGHPFATDLDILGDHSLHRLVDTAVSREGGERLAGWLLATAPDPAASIRRAALVRELVPLTTFRDKLTLRARAAGGDRRIHGDRLRAWITREAPGAVRAADVMIAAALALVNAVLFILFLQDALPALWIGSFVLYFGFTFIKLGSAGDVFMQGLDLRDAVLGLSAVFGYLERDRYGRHAGLRTVAAPFLDPANRPTAQFNRLNLILSASSLRYNIIAWGLVNAVVPWDLFFAYRLAASRRALARHLPAWLDAWFELEALSSLANFAYLNPDYSFPALEGEAQINGAGLGHPLIPFEQKVRNDFALAGRGSIVLITGSNMSGKSTFLRTLGVNLALAYAGSAVDAAHFSAAPLRLFTCIKVSDSVTDGFSYFYAEVRRLRALLEALDQADTAPVFFLIDEIFKGTNNRERLIGSRSYIRALAGHDGLGAVSTHDLELVRLADALPSLRNQHFREEVQDGRMAFDYQLREGPSPTTNALKIMALEGLPVDVDGIDGA